MLARLTLLTTFFALVNGFAGDIVKVGIIGADTSHVPAFTEMFNDPKATGDLADFKVVAVFAGGSQDIPQSKDRIGGYMTKLKAMGVESVDTIDALLQKVDVVLLESIDGRVHLQQVLPVLKAKKPVFIDKPLAATLADVVEIYRVAAELKVPCFSSSALRFSPGVIGAAHDPRAGQVLGCEAWSPCHLEPHHPDLFWYGIHGVEELFTIMGPGCESVTRVQNKDCDIAVGVWKDGRIGTFRGLRAGKEDYGSTVFGSKSIVSGDGFGGYQPLVVEIAKFFKSGKPPVSPEETIEIYAFMEAAHESTRQGGVPVTLESVLKKAKAVDGK